MENKVGKKAPKHLDDDEDRKNPAYIPRKGLFFEHDLRGQTQEEEVRYVRIPPGLLADGERRSQTSTWSFPSSPAVSCQDFSGLCCEKGGNWA